jgi:hypothetical protein
LRHRDLELGALAILSSCLLLGCLATLLDLLIGDIQLVSGTDDSYSHSPSWGSGGFVVPDTDGDGVTDADDMCPATSLGDPPEKLKKNRFAADATGLFVDVQGTESGFSVVDAFGCDEDQIIELMNLGAGHNKFGITRSVLLTFISMY